MIGMSRIWLGLIAISIVASASVMLFYQPASSQQQTELLLSESMALSDQLQTQQKLSIMLSESVSIADQITAQKP